MFDFDSGTKKSIILVPNTVWLDMSLESTGVGLSLTSVDEMLENKQDDQRERNEKSFDNFSLLTQANTGRNQLQNRHNQTHLGLSVNGPYLKHSALFGTVSTPLTTRRDFMF